MRLLTLLALCCLMTMGMEAQIKTPAPSPMCKMTQTVGLSDFTVEYSRPGVKGRTIFASDGLVPYGEMWRTGANASTKVKFSDDVTIDGKDVPAGNYALYTIPNADSWEVMLYKNTSHWGTPGKAFKEDEIQVKLSAKPKSMANTVETFTIKFANITSNKCDMVIAWENTQVSFPISVDVDTRVMNNIQKVMGGVSRGDYYTAARYFYDNDKDSQQALTWVKKANEMDAKFWQLRLQSEIEAKMGNYTTAIKTAEKSKAAAFNADNQDYIRINEKNISKWKGMIGSKS
ncbi:MAG: DUF2911 domain-containing protein [Saprospiraceae bacterium]|nr:DUF2911 domain-containing protein [Saprospiraceae bacterium]